MASSSSSSSSGGIGLFGALFLVLFVLKLGVGDTQVEDWSWWWVTAPLWGSFLLFGFIFLVIVVLAAIFS